MAIFFIMVVTLQLSIIQVEVEEKRVMQAYLTLQTWWASQIEPMATSPKIFTFVGSGLSTAPVAPA